MPTLIGIDRLQLTFSSLEQSIAADNEVRFIDAFVDKLNLHRLGVPAIKATDKKESGESNLLGCDAAKSSILILIDY